MHWKFSKLSFALLGPKMRGKLCLPRFEHLRSKYFFQCKMHWKFSKLSFALLRPKMWGKLFLTRFKHLWSKQNFWNFFNAKCIGNLFEFFEGKSVSNFFWVWTLRFKTCLDRFYGPDNVFPHGFRPRGLHWSSQSGLWKFWMEKVSTPFSKSALTFFL